MKLYRKNYKFKTDKLDKVKLFCITDMHYTMFSNYKLDIVLDTIKNENPDYVVFTGDLIDSHKRVDVSSFELLYEFFKSVTSKYKVIFIKGNHDIFGEEECEYDYKGCFNKLFRLDNFYYLCDDSIEFDNICFYGYEMDSKYYYEDREKDTTRLIDKINKTKFKDKYNVILFHSPINIYKNMSNIKSIDKIDLILCGHMHNGMVSNILDFGKSDIGILSPRKGLFPNSSRNMKIYDKTRLIVLYPLTFFHLLEKYKIERFYRPGYTIIEIEK